MLSLPRAHQTWGSPHVSQSCAGQLLRIQLYQSRQQSYFSYNTNFAIASPPPNFKPKLLDYPKLPPYSLFSSSPPQPFILQELPPASYPIKLDPSQPSTNPSHYLPYPPSQNFPKLLT